MECKKCGSTWSVLPEKAKKITKCPFCGSDLFERSIESQIRIMVQESGPEVLTNNMRINSILADLFPGSGRERTTIRSALDIGAGRMFYEIAMNSAFDLDSRIQAIRNRLMEEAWLSETACDYICTVFLGAIDVSMPSPGRRRPESETGPVREEDLAGGGQKTGPAAGDSLQAQAENLYRAAMWQLERGQTEVAAINLRKVADGGKLEALANMKLGELYKDQPELAIRYYSRAADLGNPAAQNITGCMYENGEGTEKDLIVAVKYYELAVKNKHRGAQHNLGVLYYMGKGVPKDYEKAYELFLSAAMQESPGAQNNLGVMFEYGQGVVQNKKHALYWYKKASDNGSRDGQANYERLLKWME